MRLLYPANIRFPMERANSVQVVNTCYALAEAGVDVSLWVRRMDSKSINEGLNFYGLLKHPNLNITKLLTLNIRSSPFIWNYSYYISCLLNTIKEIFLRKKIEFVYTRSLILAYIFIKLSYLTKAKIIYEVHSINNSPFESFILKKVNGIVVITNQLKNIIQNKFKISSPIEVIPDGTNLIESSEITPLSNRDKKICYTGHLYEWKGVDILIKSMQYINSDVELVIVGGMNNVSPNFNSHNKNFNSNDKDLERLKSLAVKCGVSDRVKFTGFVRQPEVKKYLLNSKVAVLPLLNTDTNEYYTSPLKLFEYMSSGTPIVASDLLSIREVLTHNENAIMVQPESPEALANGINFLLDNQDISERISKRALIDVQKYSWKERAKRIIKFLESI